MDKLEMLDMLVFTIVEVIVYGERLQGLIADCQVGGEVGWSGIVKETIAEPRGRVVSLGKLLVRRRCRDRLNSVVDAFVGGEKFVGRKGVEEENARCNIYIGSCSLLRFFLIHLSP